MKANPIGALLLLLNCLAHIALAQSNPSGVPAIYSNIFQDAEGKYYIQKGEEKIYERISAPKYTLQGAIGKPTGTAQGIAFDFGQQVPEGTLVYGFIPFGDSDHPHPVYFRSTARIAEGKANVSIVGMKDTYDMIGWEKNGKGTLGYRVVNARGEIVYDGMVDFTGKGPFQVAPSIIEGPFVNLLQADGATISFTTNLPILASVEVGGKTFSDAAATTQHEIKVSGLLPAQNYPYTVKYGELSRSFAFKTAPKPGTRSAFTFAYASDSRDGNGGGERDVYGVNFYIMKKIAALTEFKNAAFFQFSGDLINGYLSQPDEIRLQYANWKRAVQPFWHYLPIYVSMGNHEALSRVFANTNEGYGTSVDRFPFATESAEAVFNGEFVQPTNGPDSEDGAAYDPNPNQVDFPSYKENVFYYTYDNVAVLVLNSNYIYSPSTNDISLTSGGLHAYIMDQQVKWIEQTIAKLESDKTIDHIFITEHTPFFPNGGHVKDDMWYSGNNKMRSWVAGKELDKGIIERRDEMLDIFLNKSKKVIAIMTGDEHNYAKTEIGPQTNIYPEGWTGKKINLSRTIWQINNGAAGAPYYAQEQTPWTPKVTGFTTQNALVFFHVKGKKISMEVLNPDTLEEVDRLEMR